jgi:hypothetical protein
MGREEPGDSHPITMSGEGPGRSRPSLGNLHESRTFPTATLPQQWLRGFCLHSPSSPIMEPGRLGHLSGHFLVELAVNVMAGFALAGCAWNPSH